VVFATPGMLHAGQSLQIFRKWAGNEKNMVIMPGYCVQGTVGHKILSGQRKLEMEGRQIVSWIFQFPALKTPQNHLQVWSCTWGLFFPFCGCFVPLSSLPLLPTNNAAIFQHEKETPSLLPPAAPQLPQALKNSFSLFYLFFPPQSFRLVSPEQALKELGLAEHQLRFTCRVHIQDPRKEHETVLRVYNHLKG
ncbi:INT11 protein, partial [Prunella himalayana]|nr:INT11 protein [Prunella himalayana]